MTDPDIPRPASGFAGSGLACLRGERLVFSRLAFSLPAGGALLLTGPNGSGKTSLLRVMAGLTPLAEGRLLWGGAEIGEDRAAHRARLHFIGHQDAVKPSLTAAETLAFWAGMRGGAARHVAAALEQFRLTRLAASPCRLLSAGQKRRVALARLVASPAPLWLLDEPLSGLDEEAVADLAAALAAHRAQGGSVALSTHTPFELSGAATLSLLDFQARA